MGSLVFCYVYRIRRWREGKKMLFPPSFNLRHVKFHYAVFRFDLNLTEFPLKPVLSYFSYASSSVGWLADWLLLLSSTKLKYSQVHCWCSIETYGVQLISFACFKLRFLRHLFHRNNPCSKDH